MSEENAASAAINLLLPYAVTLGSAVRIKGIVQFLRTRLPAKARSSLDVRGSQLVLANDDTGALRTAITNALEGIELRPVIPREAEDILSISSTERHRWLKNGRLPSAGTRTVKLRGRAKKITFHVFDPQVIEDLANRDVVVEWREQDAETAAQNRRRASHKARRKPAGSDGGEPDANEDRPQLKGWEEFERDGPLRERR